ncbi:4'-phosphopantetheinyl transferase family protein [Stieleria tagensis]|uniref:4'-phosphopantetheinyl transferase family protein n=1 Tax=Stieleria tagensis TaxID=2956795 RepID=UPI00209B4CCB|nr:4'-phosphopantetheinyl transferase superfamily protein [Stieleria tagensis]
MQSQTCHLRVWHAATSRTQRGEFESRCERLLDQDELRSADRFRLATSRNQHVVGRAMARRLLGDLAVDPQSIRFDIGQHGKPVVSHPAAAQQPFNIAHTDGLVLCGIADQGADLVGVDVEATGRRTSTELAERYFSRPEVKFLRSRPAEQQKFYFLRIWTLKEAYIKAIGTGLHTPLADFAFNHIDSDQPRIEFLATELQDQRDWKFVCFQPRPGFIASAALAAKQPQSPVTVDWQAFEGLDDDADDQGA